MNLEELRAQIEKENPEMFPDSAPVKRRQGRFYDFLTVQCIVCIALVIIFLLVKLVSPGAASSALSETKTQIANKEPDTKTVINYAQGVIDGLTAPDAVGGDCESAPVGENISVGSQLCVPVYGRITSGFGERENPFDGSDEIHKGVDIAADEGSPVTATADGTVITAGEGSLAGIYAEIDHGNGLVSRYLHCSELCVSEGDTVKAGDVIAKVGSTGNSTGPHLHFELKQDGCAFDPCEAVDFDD